MYYEDPPTHHHDLVRLVRPDTEVVFLIYFRPKTNKLDDVLFKDPRVTRFDIVGRTVMASFILGYEVLRGISCLVYIDADRSIALLTYPDDLGINVLMSDYEVTEALRRLIREGKVLNVGYHEVIRSIYGLGYRVYYLHEGGVRVGELGSCRSVFILGTNVDAPRPHAEHEVISIGPRPYQANHVVTYINWLRLHKST